MPNRSPLKSALPLVALLTLVWGTTWGLFPYAVKEVSVWTFRAVSVTFAGFSLLAIAALRGLPLSVPRASWPTLAGSTDFGSIESRGGSAHPNLNFDIKNIGPGGGWNFGVAAGLLYATERFHDYYYEVAPAYVTGTRPAFDARGGYSGSRVTLALSKRFQRVWVGAFARYDNLTGARFEDSPLVRSDHAFMAGLSVAWIFAESRQLVEEQD